MKDFDVHFLHRFLAVTYLLDNLMSARLYLNVRCNKALLFQNELIIQIMTESHEIDNLKRKVEDAKMKLVTEIKVQINFIRLFLKPVKKSNTSRADI